MKNKTTAITLVRNGTVLYPFTESDYEKLAGLGVPIINLTSDYLPLLATYAKSRGVSVQTVPFEPIEHDMLSTKVTPKWKHDLKVTSKELVLSYSKDESEARVDNLVAALKRWYRKHYITFDVQIKRTAKRVTVTMRKVYGQPA